MPDFHEVLLKMQPEVVEEVDFDNYTDAQDFPPPVPRGKYTLIQGKPDFNLTADGQHLVIAMNHKISGGEYDGRTLMFDRVSNKTFDRDGSKVSMAADHVRAIDSTARPTNREELGEFFIAAEGKTFNAQLDWEAACGQCLKAEADRSGEQPTRDFRRKVTFRGEGSFDLSPSGGRKTTANCKECGAELQARNRIVRRIPSHEAS